MNKRVKKLWLEALRSGEYEQGKGRLLTTNSVDKFCCLGVLCDLHARETDEHYWNSEDGYFDEDLFLPPEVQEWAGLREESPDVGPTSLTLHNDGSVHDGGASRPPKSFEKIANLIERHL